MINKFLKSKIINLFFIEKRKTFLKKIGLMKTLHKLKRLKLVNKYNIVNLVSKEKIKNPLPNFNIRAIKDSLSTFNLKEINPENVVLITLIISGFVLSLIIYIALNIPLSKSNDNLKEEIKEFQLKKDNISKIKSNYKTIKFKTSNLKSDRQFLINLIAGTKNLDTFMAVLNKNAIKNRIEIIEFEPQNVSSYKNINLEDEGNLNSYLTQESSQNKTDNDKFLIIPEIEKHQIQISLVGNYNEILNFIRDIELLENIVLIGDFEIKGLNDVSKKKKIKVGYQAKVSAFGRVVDK